MDTPDLVTVAAIWNKLRTYIDQCGDRVMFSCHSPVMALARDLGPALLTPQGDIVALAEFSPGHTIASELVLKSILKRIKEFAPGDLILANDGHIVKAGHLADWSFVVPFFWQNELVFFGHFHGHMCDSGGSYSGCYFPRAYDCIAEGLNIPPVKIIREGKVNTEVREVILDNNRNPVATWADVLLIYNSLLRVEEDIHNLIKRFGLDTVKESAAEIMRRSEEAMGSLIKDVPDGVYTAQAAVDWDGTTPDRQVWIRLRMTIKGHEMILDFSDSDDQVDFINSVLGLATARAMCGVFIILSPKFPVNHGAMTPIKMIAPEGKVMNPTRPHTYGGAGPTTSKAVMEAVMLALAQAVPERAVGIWSRHFSPDIQGRLPVLDPRTGRTFEYFWAPFIEEGGSGAVKGYDGWEGIGPSFLLNTQKRGSVEENELFLPGFRYETVELAMDSEGPGEFRGGRGVYAERVYNLPPGSLTFIQTGCNDGQTTPVPGVAGAPQGSIGQMYIQRAGKADKEIFKTMEIFEVYPSDRMFVTSHGGGGWGDPLNRDPEKVKFDAMEGLLSFKRAEQVYGVVLTQIDKDNPETIQVDYEATKLLRDCLERQGRS